MIVNSVWNEEWGYGNDQVMIASNGVEEYRLRCVFKDGKYIANLVKVNLTTGDEEPVSESVTEYASSTGAKDTIVKWGESIATKWLNDAKKQQSNICS